MSNGNTIKRKSSILDEKNHSIILDIDDNIAITTNLRSSEIAMGETSIKYRVFNHCSFPIAYGSRLGINVPLRPMEQITLGEKGFRRIWQGTGIYVICEVDVNGWAVREMIRHYNELSYNPTDKEIYLNNRLYRHISQYVINQWNDRFSTDYATIPNRTNANVGKMTFRIAFFIPESELMDNESIYEKDLDLTFTRRPLEGKIYHPSFFKNNSEIKQIVMEELKLRGAIETILYINRTDGSKIYRKIGNKYQIFESRQPTADEEDGIYHYGTFLDENNEPTIKYVKIKLEDTEGLKEYGFFRTMEEARLHNSDIELARIKSEMAMKEQEYKQRVMEIENQHREEIQKLKIEETKLKLQDTQESIIDKREERVYKQEERVVNKVDREEERKFKQEERIQVKADKQEDRKIKLEDKELEYRDKLIEARIKQQEAENKLASKASDNTSRNMASTAAIVTGTAAIIGAGVKLASTTSTTSAVGSTIAGIGSGILSAIGVGASGIVSGVIGAPVAAAAAVGAGVFGIVKGIGKLFNW